MIRVQDIHQSKRHCSFLQGIISVLFQPHWWWNF